MAFEIKFYYERPTIIEAYVSGYMSEENGAIVVWEYKRSTSSKWSDVENDNGTIVETAYKSGQYASSKVTITDLYSYTQYDIRARVISLDDGSVLTDGYITGSWWTLAAPVVDLFEVYEPEAGSLLFDWTFGCSNVYYDITEVEVQARRQGTVDWWTKFTATIYDSEIEIDSITVDDYGTFEFRMILRTYEAETISDIVTATAAAITLEAWQWETSISKTSIIPFDGEFHPVTAKEWKEFRERLDLLKEYLESNKALTFPDYPSVFTSISIGSTFTPEIYNEVAEALIYISGKFGGVATTMYTLSDETPISARLFISLRDQYNYLISCL